MHNGTVPEFQKIKLLVLNLVAPDIFVRMSGSTDSEHVFALFLHLLGKEKRQPSYQISIDDLTETIEATISTLLHLMSYAGITGKSSLNMAFTNGTHVVTTRFRGNVEATEEPPSLYYCMGEEFDEEEGYFRCPSEMESGSESDSVGLERRSRKTEDAPVTRTDSWKQSCDKSVRSGASESPPPGCPCATKGLVVSSAPLGRENTNTDKHWTLIPRSCMLVCKGDYDDVSAVESVTMKCIHVCPENALLAEVVCRYLDTVRQELSCLDMYAPVRGMLKQPHKHNMTDNNNKWGKLRSPTLSGTNSPISSPIASRRGFVASDGCYVSKSCCDFLLLESKQTDLEDSDRKKLIAKDELFKITHNSISQVLAAGPAVGVCPDEGYRMRSPSITLENNTPFSVDASGAEEARKRSPAPPPSPVSPTTSGRESEWGRGQPGATPCCEDSSLRTFSPPIVPVDIASKKTPIQPQHFSFNIFTIVGLLLSVYLGVFLEPPVGEI
jgi:hypothetical protein